MKTSLVAPTALLDGKAVSGTINGTFETARTFAIALSIVATATGAMSCVSLRERVLNVEP